MTNKLSQFIFDGVGVPRFQKYLNLTSLRHKLIAGNVVNVSTPGYRSQDIDFQAELKKLSKEDSVVKGKMTHAKHIPLGNHPDRLPEVKSMRVKSGSMNSVDIDSEVSKMAQNELLYTVAARIMRGKFEGLRKVINSK